MDDPKKPKFLAYILLIISIMRAVLKKKDTICEIKTKLIEGIFSFISHSHLWFHIQLKFKSVINEKQFYGLYEHLLVHTIALTASMTCEQYNKLEKYIFEVIMGFDYYRAVFSTNLWVSLCRIGNPQLQINILQNLLRIYQKLEYNPSFATSPQQVNLSHTIEIFFQSLKYPEKLLIYKQFNIQDNQNINIWCALKISNLPGNIEIPATRFVAEKLIKTFDLSNKNEPYDIETLINYMKLVSTCSFNESNHKIEELIGKSWCKVCPNCSNITLQKNLNMDSKCFFRYIESLVSLTECYIENFENGEYVSKILHVISNILLKGNNEFTILLFKTFCKLLCQSDNEDNTEMDLLINALKTVKTETDLQNHLFSIINSNDDINDMITPILNKDPTLAEMKYNLVEYKTELQKPVKRRKQLEMAIDYKFIHKCIENSAFSSKLENVNTSNFHIDIDSLFDDKSDEPMSKKAKLDMNIEKLIANLENDVLLLSQAKENILSSEHKNRIKNLCDNLRNIVS